MSNLDKLNRILSNKESTWRQEAEWRSTNESWLSDSFNIAVRVLSTLRTKGMTQKELAEKMNVSPQFISKIVKGQENLSLETIAKLSHALGVQLIHVPGNVQAREVEYSIDLAYEVIERDRQGTFRKAKDLGFAGLKDMQEYHNSQSLEYKKQA